MELTTKEIKILSEKTSLFLLVLEKNGAIVNINKRCDTLFPSNLSKIIGMDITGFMIDEDVHNFKKSLIELSSKNSVINCVVRFPTENTGIVSLKLDLVLHNELIYATGTDTTQENKEHQALMSLSKLTKTGAWYFNPKNEELYWSKECYRLHELNPQTPMSKEKGMGYYAPESRERVENYLDHLIKTKTPYDYREKIITEKGTEKWIRVVAQPVIYKGKVVYVNGSITDITERHHYIEKLKLNEETKHLALKGIRSGLFDHWIEKNEVFYSVDFKKMLGLPLDQDFVPIETYRKMIHTDDIKEALERHHKNLKKEGYHYFNYYRLKHKGGEYRHYEVYGYRKKNKKGKTVRIIGNLIDVHQKKLDEKTIVESRNKLQAMINDGFVYAVLLNTKGEILMADDNSLKIIKKDYHVDPMQEPCLFIDVIPLNFKNTFAHEFNEALKGNTQKKEIERITHKGSVQWLEVKYAPIMDTANNVNSVLASFLDITDSKLAALATKEAYIKEQELNDLKSNILSNFSHEIRTPLNGILTISQLLLDEENSQERKKLLKYMKESKDRLLETVNNLSNLSKLNTVQEYLTYTDEDINYVVESSYREHKHLAKAKNLEYHLDLDDNSPIGHIDFELFRTALNNIIHNAIKFTNEGGIFISITTTPMNNTIYISVKDTGIGIEKKNINKIFDPFVQESIGLSRKYEGTGIGLSLSKKYIEILGGSLKIKSKIGKGTEFIIIIPQRK